MYIVGPQPVPSANIYTFPVPDEHTIVVDWTLPETQITHVQLECLSKYCPKKKTKVHYATI